VSTVDHIAGETYHGRRGAVKNAFRYGIDYVLLDADADLETPGLFARNAGNLMSRFGSISQTRMCISSSTTAGETAA